MKLQQTQEQRSAKVHLLAQFVDTLGVDGAVAEIDRQLAEMPAPKQCVLALKFADAIGMEMSGWVAYDILSQTYRRLGHMDKEAQTARVWTDRHRTSCPATGTVVCTVGVCLISPTLGQKGIRQ